MAVNKVVYKNKTLVDLTSDTVTKATLLKGYVAHDKSGTRIIGTYEAGAEVGDILENGFTSGDVTYVDNGSTIVATNNTTGQVLTKIFGSNTVTVTLTESGKQTGKLIRTYSDDYSVITTTNSSSNTTTVKTFDFTNNTVTIITKNSSGTTTKTLTKRLS